MNKITNKGLLQIVAILLILCSSNVLADQDFERVLWKGTPLPINLKVNSERAVVVENAQEVQVGIPVETENKLSVTTISGRVWLTALEPLVSEKIIFKTDTDKIVLIVNAGADYLEGQPIVISVPTPIQETYDKALKPDCAVGLVEATRYALQHAYAPERLLKSNLCITPIAHQTKEINLFNCLQMGDAVCGGGVVATPIAAWRAGRLHISLLEIENRLKTSVRLDPRAIVGSFKAASFAHHNLAPVKENEQASLKGITALVLISERSLMASIPPERRN